MKKIDIINAVNALSRIPVNKVKNDKVKFSLVANYRRLRKAAREIDEDRDVVVKKFQEDWKDEIEAVGGLRANRQPVTGHADFLKSEADVNKQIDAMYQEDLEVEGLVPISLEDLVKAVGDTDLSFEAVNNLDCIIA